MEFEKGPLPQRYTGPGLVDLQVNGYAGFDFNGAPETWNASELHRIRKAMAGRGVVAALPTFITDDPQDTLARTRRYAELIESDPQLEQAFPKLHIEGPFIAPEDGPLGVHPLAACTTPEAHPEFFDDLIEASSGRIGILTLAPEVPGALELISQATERGVCVAIGHTQADNDTLHAAVDAGAKLSTHLGNGTDLVLPRLDNYVQTQLAEDRLFASFIADGHHIPFGTLKNFLRAKTLEHSILVTDAIAATGAGPGRYSLGSQTIEVSQDLRASIPRNGGLAGSALTLDKAVLNIVKKCGFTFENAWAMASRHPATLIGLSPPANIEVEVHAGGFNLISGQPKRPDVPQPAV